VECQADNPTFRDLRTAESYRWVIVFRAGPDDASSDLLGAIDMGMEVRLRGIEEHTVKWSAAAGRVLSIGLA
jgi:hypothetical protein